MCKIVKIFGFEVLVIALLSACQPATKAKQPAFIQNQHWLSSTFVDALAADGTVLSSAVCMELHFQVNDSVLVVSCGSEATLCSYQVLDDHTLEITSGFGEQMKPHITATVEGEIVMSGVYDQALHFRSFDQENNDSRELSIQLVSQHLAGTYERDHVLDRPDRAATPVVFYADGKVSGLGEYTQFEPAVGGDLAATEGNMIYFISDKGELPCSWSKNGNSLVLWKLKNESAPDEKPWYLNEELYETLIKKGK